MSINVYSVPAGERIAFGNWNGTNSFNLYNLDSDHIGYVNINGTSFDVFNSKGELIQRGTNQGGGDTVHLYDLDNKYVAYWLMR